eukprot:TRINITY_DN3228_c2_g2_i1.p1 TRINITY_DN3228_c2_g2~~TRINITY_DN3228_c2_g2_i1.p1  ORF type:complete len:696 (+),score=220.27 TRINITY_DN3228_c2_g2_i1:209-2089(+)
MNDLEIFKQHNIIRFSFNFGQYLVFCINTEQNMSPQLVIIDTKKKRINNIVDLYYFSNGKKISIKNSIKQLELVDNQIFLVTSYLICVYEFDLTGVDLVFMIKSPSKDLIFNYLYVKSQTLLIYYSFENFRFLNLVRIGQKFQKFQKSQKFCENENGRQIIFSGKNGLKVHKFKKYLSKFTMNGEDLIFIYCHLYEENMLKYEFLDVLNDYQVINDDKEMIIKNSVYLYNLANSRRIANMYSKELDNHYLIINSEGTLIFFSLYPHNYTKLPIDTYAPKWKNYFKSKIIHSFIVPFQKEERILLTIIFENVLLLFEMDDKISPLPAFSNHLNIIPLYKLDVSSLYNWIVVDHYIYAVHSISKDIFFFDCSKLKSKLENKLFENFQPFQNSSTIDNFMVPETFAPFEPFDNYENYENFENFENFENYEMVPSSIHIETEPIMPQISMVYPSTDVMPNVDASIWDDIEIWLNELLKVATLHSSNDDIEMFKLFYSKLTITAESINSIISSLDDNCNRLKKLLVNKKFKMFGKLLQLKKISDFPILKVENEILNELFLFIIEIYSKNIETGCFDGVILCLICFLLNQRQFELSSEQYEELWKLIEAIDPSNEFEEKCCLNAIEILSDIL